MHIHNSQINSLSSTYYHFFFNVVCKIRNPSYSAVVERSLHATRNFWAIISKDINCIEISLNISSFLSFFAKSSDMTTRSWFRKWGVEWRITSSDPRVPKNPSRVNPNKIIKIHFLRRHSYDERDYKKNNNWRADVSPGPTQKQFCNLGNLYHAVNAAKHHWNVIVGVKNCFL